MLFATFDQQEAVPRKMTLVQEKIFRKILKDSVTFVFAE